MCLKVVLDTNIPILLFEGLFNLENEIERLIPQKHKIVFLSACLEELKLIAKKSNKLQRAVKFALQFLERFEIIEFNPREIPTTDQKITLFARENKSTCVVVTNDKELRRILRDEAIPVVFIKKKGFIELLGTL